MKSDYGYVPSTGIKIDNRISILQSDFTLKNSLGFTKFHNYDVTGNTHNEIGSLWMFDFMLEYNLFPMEKHHLGTVTKKWTPYMGLGANIIYRPTEPKTFITIKGSLGLKYKLNNNLILIIEGYLEWDFSDNLDGKTGEKTTWYQYDHTANFAIGLSYRFGGKP